MQQQRGLAALGAIIEEVAPEDPAEAGIEHVVEIDRVVLVPGSEKGKEILLLLEPHDKDLPGGVVLLRLVVELLEPTKLRAELDEEGHQVLVVDLDPIVLGGELRPADPEVLQVGFELLDRVIVEVLLRGGELLDQHKNDWDFCLAT